MRNDEVIRADSGFAFVGTIERMRKGELHSFADRCKTRCGQQVVRDVKSDRNARGGPDIDPWLPRLLRWRVRSLEKFVWDPKRLPARGVLGRGYVHVKYPRRRVVTAFQDLSAGGRGPGWLAIEPQAQRRLPFAVQVDQKGAGLRANGG